VTTNRYSENVATFKCLETTVTNQNVIHEEIKSKLNSGNSLYDTIITECGAGGGITGRGNRSTQRNLSLCPPQIP
jgi:hypothetical protein